MASWKTFASRIVRHVIKPDNDILLDNGAEQSLSFGWMPQSLCFPRAYSGINKLENIAGFVEQADCAIFYRDQFRERFNTRLQKFGFGCAIRQCGEERSGGTQQIGAHIL